MERCRVQPGYWFKDFFQINKKVKEWYDSPSLNTARQVLQKDGYHPRIKMEIFSKKAIGNTKVDEAIAVLKMGTGYFEGNKFINCWNKIEVTAVYSGEQVKNFHPVMTISGDYSFFCHLEPLLLAILSGKISIMTSIEEINAVMNNKIIFVKNKTEIKNNYNLVMTSDNLTVVYENPIITAVKTANWARENGVVFVPVIDLDEKSAETALNIARMTGEMLWGICFRISKDGPLDHFLKAIREKLDENFFVWIKIILLAEFEFAVSNKAKINDLWAIVKDQPEYMAKIVSVEKKSIAKSIKNPCLKKVS